MIYKSKKMLLTILILISIAGFSYTTFSQNNSSYTNTEKIVDTLSSEKINRLQSKKALTHISRKGNKQRLIYTPSLPLFRELTNFVKKRKPNILYESLYFLPVHNNQYKEELFLKVANLLRNVPLLATIEYTNQKDGNIHPLFKSSEILPFNNRGKTQTDLPIILTPPINARKNKIYVLQDMPPFGYVTSQYTYNYDNYYTQFLGNNTSPITYETPIATITAVKKSDMFTSTWVIKTKEGILIYGVGAVKTSPMASLFSRVIENSFSSRMIGLFEWLNKKISE